MTATGDWTDAVNKARAFVAQLTLEEKVNITTGVDIFGRCVGWASLLEIFYCPFSFVSLPLVDVILPSHYDAMISFISCIPLQLWSFLLLVLTLLSRHLSWSQFRVVSCDDLHSSKTRSLISELPCSTFFSLSLFLDYSVYGLFSFHLSHLCKILHSIGAWYCCPRVEGFM